MRDFFVCSSVFASQFYWIFLFWLHKQWKNTGACLIGNRKLPLSLRHTCLPPPPPVSHLLPVLILRVYSSYPSSVLSHTPAHTHILRYVPLSYPERKPYSVHSLQLCVINSVSSWLSYSPSPLSFFKDNLACWNHVNFPLPSGGNFLRKLWSTRREAQFPSWLKEANAFKLPEAALPRPLALFSSPSATDKLHFSCELQLWALRPEQLPKPEREQSWFFFLFFFNKGLCLERGRV